MNPFINDADKLLNDMFSETTKNYIQESHTIIEKIKKLSSLTN